MKANIKPCKLKHRCAFSNIGSSEEQAKANALAWAAFNPGYKVVRTTMDFERAPGGVHVQFHVVPVHFTWGTPVEK